MSYDEIYEKFLDLCGYDISELPQEDVLIYRLINNGVGLYNRKAKKYSDILQGDVVCDNETETINKKLNEVDLLILAYFMCFITASNKYLEYTSLWGTVANETGIKDYKSNCASKKDAINYFENQIKSLIEDEIVSFNY